MQMFTALALLGGSVVVAASRRGEQHGTSKWIPKFENLVAFGDSYTDESRLSYFQNHNGSAPPPGLLLPESNDTAGGGITWPRFVSFDTGAKLYDYAVSGAVCSNKIVSRYLSSINGPFPDVVYEVSAFLADTKYINTSTGTNTLYTNRQADNTVYSMWIGTNDLGDGAFITDSTANGTTIPDYVDCIYDRFDGIYSAGGRYFVLMNTAPLQFTPLYGLPGLGGDIVSTYWPDKPDNTTEISYKMKEYTKLVNSLFNYRTPFEILIAKRYPGASIAIFDVNSLITDIYNNPSAYLDSPANATGQYHRYNFTSGQYYNADESLNTFLWYDDLHPSNKTDTVIAKEFANVVYGNSKYATYW